jgi:chemotaxis protein CheX
MPLSVDISDTTIRNLVIRAVADVFRTMLNYSPEPVEHGPADPLASAPHVVGTVGFVGEANGLMYLYFEEAFARKCTQDMLGVSERELADLGMEGVNDAIGELTNMTVGGFKNGLCDAGYPCKLTVPSILRATRFSIAPVSDARASVHHFTCNGHRIRADVLLKSGGE